MKVLLTGPYGNVGGCVLEELLRQRYEVRTFGLKKSRNEKIAAKYAGRIEAVWGDMRDIKTIRPAVEGVDCVLHLAAIIPPRSDDEPDLARAVNVDGTRKLLTSVRRKIRRRGSSLFPPIKCLVTPNRIYLDVKRTTPLKQPMFIRGPRLWVKGWCAIRGCRGLWLVSPTCP